jgi:hypothetical protein
VPAAHKTLPHPTPELAAVAQTAVQGGLHAELPPHISTLLGLTHEQKCDVRQGVLRTTGTVQGIDVLENNHADIVIFTVDIASKDQTFYLTSPDGKLRKVLNVRQGMGEVGSPTQADLEAFRKEKKMWEEKLATHPATR